MPIGLCLGRVVPWTTNWLTRFHHGRRGDLTTCTIKPESMPDPRATRSPCCPQCFGLSASFCKDSSSATELPLPITDDLSDDLLEIPCMNWLRSIYVENGRAWHVAILCCHRSESCHVNYVNWSLPSVAEFALPCLAPYRFHALDQKDEPTHCRTLADVGNTSVLRFWWTWLMCGIHVSE